MAYSGCYVLCSAAIWLLSLRNGVLPSSVLNACWLVVFGVVFHVMALYSSVVMSMLRSVWPMSPFLVIDSANVPNMRATARAFSRVVIAEPSGPLAAPLSMLSAYSISFLISTSMVACMC